MNLILATWWTNYVTYFLRLTCGWSWSLSMDLTCSALSLICTMQPALIKMFDLFSYNDLQMKLILVNGWAGYLTCSSLSLTCTLPPADQDVRTCSRIMTCRCSWSLSPSRASNLSSMDGGRASCEHKIKTHWKKQIRKKLIIRCLPCMLAAQLE